MDHAFIEALFSKSETTPIKISGSPLVVGVDPEMNENAPDSFDEAMKSMELSLEIQKLFSEDSDQVEIPPEKLGVVLHENSQLPVKKVDKRLKPYSTCKRRNRRRPKHELEYLRATVMELQEELEALSKANNASSTAVGHETALTTINSNWKDMAQQQKLLFEKSLEENRKLRNRLLGQLEVVRVMEAAISQHQRETGHSIINGVGRALNRTDHDIFAQLNASVDKQLGEVNTVLTTNGLTNVLHQLSGGFDFKREANGISFRHEEARLLPFSMQSFHHAIWNCMHNRSAIKQAQAHCSNLIIRETLELPKARRINITKRSVFKRYFENNRVIFVWTSYVEIDGSVLVRLREKGWSTCSTFEFYRGVLAGASSSNNFIHGCLNRMVIELTPEVSDFESEQVAQKHIGEITDLIVGSYHQNFGFIHEVVEKMLLNAETISNAETEDDRRGKVVVM
ncbi:hypothetical protein Plhal304r1_c011g0042801 [Plasmopara halstedii]